MGLRDDLFNIFASLQGSSTSDEPTLVDIFYESFYPIIAIIAIGVIVFVIARAIRYMMSYAGDGQPLGSFKLSVMGKSMVKGNLNIHEYVTEDEINMLQQINDISEGIKDYRKLFENQELYIYDFRITDYDEAWDLKGGRDSMIVSPIPLESDKYSWLDDRGDRSIVSPTFRQKSRNIFCFITSEYHADVPTPYGKLIDVYDLVPIPKSVMTKMIGTDKEYEVVLEMRKLESGSHIANIAQYLPTLSETWKRIDPAEKEVDRLRKKLHDKDVEISDVFGDSEDYRHIAYVQPVIGEVDRKRQLGKGSLLGLLMFAVILGGLGYGLPDIVPPLAGIIEPFMGLGIVTIIFFLAVYSWQEKKSQYQDEEIEVL